MFTLFRYGLVPVVLYCLVVLAAGVVAVSTNAVHKATWPQTVVTVTQSQDFGQAFAEFRGTQNTFPDPRGTVEYAIDGAAYTWQGRGREIGVTVMKPGDQIKLYYNPNDPREISTLVLLGAATGSIVLAVAFAFLAFYVWFFWLRGFLRRSGPDDFIGDLAGLPERLPGQIEPSRSTFGNQRPAAINNRPTGKSFVRSRGATFGKR
jgi:hypothetical protein